MNFRTTARFSAAPVALSALLAGCSATPDPAPAPPAPSPSSSAAPSSEPVPDRQPHTLVLNADGSGALKEIVYTLDGTTKQTGTVRLPWRQSITVPADGKAHQWTLEISYSGSGANSIELYSVFDGKESVHTGAAGGGSGNTQLSSSVGGTVQG
ncbi:hypothetical protein [Amycolatopsis jiangsuensis]|uniref:Secreted protein n=1 Tax=Amycolatopsis jiangsuensis TaxID=1181879 RepID=A0A840IPT9_9PSEU|nr:hypothetical protein [Amycolatopsis jiangsuensis]MBB4683387.1 hypothetical protein [Amycolatopsis jiangsuensis]